MEIAYINEFLKMEIGLSDESINLLPSSERAKIVGAFKREKLIAVAVILDERTKEIKNIGVFRSEPEARMFWEKEAGIPYDPTFFERGEIRMLRV